MSEKIYMQVKSVEKIAEICGISVDELKEDGGYVGNDETNGEFFPPEFVGLCGNVYPVSVDEVDDYYYLDEEDVGEHFDFYGEYLGKVFFEDPNESDIQWLTVKDLGGSVGIGAFSKRTLPLKKLENGLYKLAAEDNFVSFGSVSFLPSHLILPESLAQEEIQAIYYALLLKEAGDL